jgi:hypothetical protein
MVVVIDADGSAAGEEFTDFIRLENVTTNATNWSRTG